MNTQPVPWILLLIRNKYFKIKRRMVTPERKNAVLGSLARDDWSPVLNELNIHRQVENLHSIINRILDTHCPIKLFKTRHDSPQWITTGIVKTMEARDKAFVDKGSDYKALRSKVQRMVRFSKRRFLKSQLNNNKDTKQWWATVKSLTTNTSKQVQAGTTVIKNQQLDGQQLCDNLNEYYKSVGDDPITLDCSAGTTNNNNIPLGSVSIG